MPIDAGIYDRYAKPVRSVTAITNDLLAQDSQGMQNQLLGQKLQEFQSGIARQQQVRNALMQLQPGATDEDRITALKGTATPEGFTQADALDKSILDRKRTQAEVDMKGAQTKEHQAAAEVKRIQSLRDGAQYAAQGLAKVNVQDDNSIVDWYRDAVDKGLITKEQAVGEINKVPAAGPARDQWKQQQQQAGMSVVEQATRDLEERKFGETKANNTRVDQRVKSEGAANRAVTMRGQDKVDARVKESTSAAMSKPFEVTGPDGNPVLVQQSKDGTITPVEGYAPKGGTGKPLPASVVKQVTEARDNSATITRLTDAFKPDFGGKGVFGLGADQAMSAKAAVGVDADAVEWWKNYRKQAELVERHALFGASLTPGEQESWRSADISPGMNPKVIERNLKTRSALAAKVAENTAADAIDAGHSSERINKIASRNAQPDTKVAPAAAPAAAQPYADAEKERRYQEWKKRNP